MPVVLAFGHRAEGEALSCDVLITSPHAPAHDLELEDVDTGARYKVSAPPAFWGQREVGKHYGITLEVRP